MVVCYDGVILFSFRIVSLLSIPLFTFILGLWSFDCLLGTTSLPTYFRYFYFILYFDLSRKVGWRGELEFDVFSFLFCFVCFVSFLFFS